MITTTVITQRNIVGSSVQARSIRVTQVTTGLTGTSGTAGGGAGAPSYLHSQPTPSTNWTVNHNLGYRPAVTALSVGGVVMFANVIHTSINQAVIEFDQPTAGQATCS